MKLQTPNSRLPMQLSRPEAGLQPASMHDHQPLLNFPSASRARAVKRAEARVPRAGFTLIELLLVIVILGILAAIVVPKFANRGEQARQAAAKTQIGAFSTALSAFEVDNGYYPRGKDGLQALIVKPNDANNWRGPYLEEKGGIPNDPWGRPYFYECPGKHNASGYDISSAGFDGKEGTEDDITNWQLGK